MQGIASKLRTRAKLGREENTRVTGELAELTDKAAAEAARSAVNGRRALPKALSGADAGTAPAALPELAVTIGRTGTVVAQARTPAGRQDPGRRDRLISLHDPECPADPHSLPAGGGPVWPGGRLGQP